MRAVLALILYGLAQTLTAADTSVTCDYQDAATAGQRVLVLCTQDSVLVSQDQGVNWQARKLLPDEKFRRIEFLDARRGYVVGDKGIVLETEDGGDTWRKIAVPTEENLTDLHFVGDSGWIAGYAGVILHSTDAGKTWTKQASTQTQPLEGIFFVDQDRGWAVGWVGIILRTTDGGKTWQQAKAPTMLWSLSSVYFRDAKEGWAVGFAGQILRSHDGGASWEAQKSPSTEWLTSIAFDSSGRGWITAGNDFLVSDDWGDTWKPLDVEGMLFLNRLLTVNKSLWAVGQFGVLQQAASGKAWTRIQSLVASTRE